MGLVKTEWFSVVCDKCSNYTDDFASPKDAEDFAKEAGFIRVGDKWFCSRHPEETNTYLFFCELFRKYSPQYIMDWGRKNWPEIEEISRLFEKEDQNDCDLGNDETDAKLQDGET